MNVRPNRVRPKHVRLKRLLPAVALPVLLLTGCGVQGLQWHPGIAATVDGQTITDKRVDDLARGYCSADPPQSSQPLRIFRSGIVAALVTKEAATQLGEQYDVRPDDTYNRAVAQARSATTKMSSGAADAYVELQSLGTYITSILDTVGDKLLTQQGSSDATVDQQSAAGLKALAGWIDGHPIDINPVYDVGVEKGQLAFTDTDDSHAVSAAARSGFAALSASQADQAYVAGLSANQVCG